MNKYTNETFINKAKLKHNNNYDYSLVDYIDNKTKVKIICPEHGIFEQSPHHHLSGIDCKECGRNKTINSRKLTIENVIKRCNQKHKNKYDYSLVNYISDRIKIKIICPKHGIFEQTPNNHLQGTGCPKCKIDNAGWNYHLWENAAKHSKNFESFKVYIIECWNDTERFYKIGKTFNPVTKRFNTKEKMPYNWKVVKIFEDTNSLEICKLENELKIINKKHSYLPKISFEGKYECFSEVNYLTFSN